jgi:hypothetical protein
VLLTSSTGRTAFPSERTTIAVIELTVNNYTAFLLLFISFFFYFFLYFGDFFDDATNEQSTKLRFNTYRYAFSRLEKR